MANWIAIQDALYDWFTAATGQPAIWAHQNQPRPLAPHGLLNSRLALAPVGRAEERLTATAGEVAIIQRYRLTVSCNLYGAGALEKMDLARLKISAPSVQDALRVAGLAFIEAGPARDLTALLETKWEARAQMDVFFGLTDSLTDAPGWIQTVEVGGTFEGGGTEAVTTSETITS